MTRRGKSPRRTARGARGLFAIPAAIGLSLLLCGCMDRALVVRTDPPGARIWVNGTDRGTTPLRLSYWRDGRYRLRIEKKGYETVADEVVTRTAFDALPGPDFFYENGPGRHVRETTRDYRLVPLQARPAGAADLEAVLRRGEAFRREAEAAAAEPGTPVPTSPNPHPQPQPPAAPTPPPAPPPAAPAPSRSR